jgi:hypothetical protein
VPFFWYSILTSSLPTPAYPPVTMKTRPAWSGTSFSVKVGFGMKKHCRMASHQIDMMFNMWPKGGARYLCSQMFQSFWIRSAFVGRM